MQRVEMQNVEIFKKKKKKKAKRRTHTPQDIYRWPTN